MRKWVAGGLVAISFALVGCGGGGGTTHVRPTHTAAAAGPWQGKQYVALGDSYTAGPDIGGAAAVSGRSACERSDRNYPHLVAARLGLHLHDVSCGGAQTVNMTAAQDRGSSRIPPQFDALGKDTDLVSVGIGGNDFSVFIRIVGGCVQLARLDPQGAPCTDQLAAHAGWLSTYVAALRTRVAKVLRGVAHRSPHARVIVVGYPQIVPASGHCDRLPLAAGDYAFARKVNLAFDRALSAAAAQEHALYADTWTASAGHDICSADPWIAGAVPDGEAAPFHPYAVEQRVVAGLIEKTLR